MERFLKVVHYINQFYSGVGGEEAAGVEVSVTKGAVGPGILIDEMLDGKGAVTHTVSCGDNYAAENLEVVTAEIIDIIKEFEPDLFIAGPGFNAGRYGLVCGALCAKVNNQLRIPAVTGLFWEAPGAELYSGLCYIIGTGNNAAGMKQDMKKVVDFGLKLVRGEEIRGYTEEGFLGTGPIKEQNSERTGPARAVDMALDKFFGRSFSTEIAIPKKDEVPPSVLSKPLGRAKIALVTDGGLVPVGNPDRMLPVNSVRFASYQIMGKQRLDAADYEVKHQGYNNEFILKDPNRLVPVDVMQSFVSEGVVGSLNERFFTTAGVMTTIENATKFGKEIAENLIADGVDAAILTST